MDMTKKKAVIMAGAGAVTALAPALALADGTPADAIVSGFGTAATDVVGGLTSLVPVVVPVVAAGVVITVLFRYGKRLFK